MRLVCISDTHALHEHLIVPDGDVLIVAGDCTNHGTLAELLAFDHWLGQQPHHHRMVVAGNHDRALLGRRKLANATVLRSLHPHTIDGVRFAGAPSLTTALPHRFDVLVTHAQPAPELLARFPPCLVVYGHCRRGRWSNKDLIRALVPGWSGEAGRYAQPAVRRFGYIRQPSGLYASCYAYASVTRSDNGAPRLTQPPVVININSKATDDAEDGMVITIDGSRLRLLGRQGSDPRKKGGYETCVPAYELRALRERTGRWSALDRVSAGTLAPVLVTKAAPRPAPSLADLVDLSALLQCDQQNDDTKFDQTNDYRRRGVLDVRQFRPSARNVLVNRTHIPPSGGEPGRYRGIFAGINFMLDDESEEEEAVAAPRSTLYGDDWTKEELAELHSAGDGPLGARMAFPSTATTPPVTRAGA